MLYTKGMKESAHGGASFPGTLLNRLAARIRRQAAGDLCLEWLPPLLVSFDLAAFLYRNNLVATQMLILAGGVLLGVPLAVGVLRYRSSAPAGDYTARLIDSKAGGQDRCLTLATLDPLNVPSFLLDRLRRETAAVLDKVDLKRDFPYRIKRSFFASLFVSFVLIVLIQFFLPAIVSLTTAKPSIRQLESLIQKMSQRERFLNMARALQTMTAQLKEPDLSPAKKRALIQQARKQVEKERAAAGPQQGEDDQKLLGETAKALRGAEQELDNGQEQKGEDRTKANSPGGGAESGQSAGAGTKAKEERGNSPTGNQGTDTSNQGMNQTQDATSDKSRGKENKTEPGKDQQQGSQPRRDEPGQETGKAGNNMGAAKEAREGKGTANPGEEIPKEAPPDRFLRPGEEGQTGVKNGRFVAVRLPEEDREIGNMNAQTGSGKSGKSHSEIPISNAPLRPPDTPDAAGEKQYLPLEYRALIR